MYFKHIEEWLQEEQLAGAPNPKQAVLSTVGEGNQAHARVIAIREINEKGFLFFTQKGTRKVTEMRKNPQASLTFWLEMEQRAIIIEGQIEELSAEENQRYWESYPRTAQIRFHSYAPTSSQAIPDKQWLEARKRDIEKNFGNDPIPLSPDYCGFRLVPERIVFYAYRTDELSDTFEYREKNGVWEKQWLSP